MNIEALRKFSLAFPDATESLQWGDALCFKVRGKLFVIVALDVDSRPRICVKCDPEPFAELIEREGLAPAPYVGRYHWVGIADLDTLSPRELQNLIERSYELIVQKLPKKKALKKAMVAKAERRTQTKLRKKLK